ncbi:hypothetical protein L596_000292 [Steinernema carpocapsae]|uniref:Uncharacterized protein n=1 Tax=Steinernema carpocapsae TaxID=34508 RepID=A0A4U8UIJ8_STECR|nr:hypothetical protein L596_000292 [Steinernema carpocapsae]
MSQTFNRSIVLPILVTYTNIKTEPVNAFPLKPIQCFSDCSMCPCGGANHFINGEPLIPCCCTNFNGFNDKTRRENLNQERGFASRPADLKQAESGLYRLKWMLPQQGRQKEMAALAECNKKVGKRTKRLVKNPKTVFEKSGSEELEEPILKQLQQQDFEACLSSTAPIFIWSDDGKALCKNNLGLSVAPHNCFSEITAHSVMPTKTTRKHLEILFPKSFGVKSGIQTASNGGSVIDKVEPNEFFENAFDGSVPNSTETSTTPLALVPSMHSSQLDEELETGHAQIIETFSVPSSNPDTLSLLAGEPDGDVYAEKDSVLEQYDSSNASRSPGLKHHRHKIGPNNQPGWAAAFRSTPKPQRTEEQIELLCYQFKPSKLTSTCLDVHTPFDVTPPKYVGEKFHVHKTNQDGIDQKTVKTRTTSSSPSTDVNIKPKGIRKTRKHLKKLSIF